MENLNEVIAAGEDFAPLVCLKCGSEQVEFDNNMQDGYCSNCGTWQIEFLIIEDNKKEQL